jgi:hypothetical protein
MRSASVSKMLWSGKRDLLLSESVFLKLLIVRKRKAAQKRRSTTNAIYFEKEIYGEFHHLYEELKNISRGPNLIKIMLCFISPKMRLLFTSLIISSTNVSVIAMKCRTQFYSDSAFPVLHSRQQQRRTKAMQAKISKYLILSTSWP